jgi:hypothetical protein
MFLYNQMSSADVLWTKRRPCVHRVQQYVEITVPNYTLDDFKSHFRLSRVAYQATCTRLRPLSDYNKGTGPVPNVEKDLLMFLWFIDLLF